MIDNETMSKVSSTSISSTQQNRNGEEISKKETTVYKDQIKQSITKYIMPHIRKANDI